MGHQEIGRHSRIASFSREIIDERTGLGENGIRFQRTVVMLGEFGRI